MKDLVAYINEMSLEQLGNYITKTLRISYDDAKEILSDKDLYNKKLYTDSQTTFKETIINFVKTKFGLFLNKDDFKSNRKKLSKTNQEKIIKSNRIVKQFLSIFGDLNDKNKQIFLDIILKNLSGLTNGKAGFLTIPEIFSEDFNLIFYSEQKNIFKVITDNLKINNIDDNFTYILKELSELTLSGGQAQGKFENLLNIFIKGTVNEKSSGDVNINILDNENLHLEVKFCRKCNFGPYKNKGNITEDNIKELFNNFNNKSSIKEKKICINDYITGILNNHGTTHCDIVDLNKFLDNYFRSKNIESFESEEDIKNCIAIYFIHWYLTNQFKINKNNNDKYYLILFKDTRSISDENYGKYIWINAKKYENTSANIKDLINFFDKNLYVSGINRGNIEISFKKNK